MIVTSFCCVASQKLTENGEPTWKRQLPAAYDMGLVQVTRCDIIKVLRQLRFIDCCQGSNHNLMFLSVRNACANSDVLMASHQDR